MKKKIIFAWLLCTLYADGAPQTSAARQQGRTSQDSRKPPALTASFVFQKIEPMLRRESRVPLRLPSFLPYVDEKHPIYASRWSATSSSYEILLAFTEDCEGQNNCLYGSVKGSSQKFEEDDGVRIPIKLLRGIKGYFIDAECFAYCNESYVGWSENGFYYSIGMKAEKKDTLIKVANSAIAAGYAKDR